MDRVRVAVIGCGLVSREYLAQMKRFPLLDVVACADLMPERSRVRAQAFEIEARSVEQVLGDEAIELIVNLTTPACHAGVTLEALAAGKHVWSEKPLATTREAGRQLVDAASAAGLRLGCAPDTFLGAAQQTARRAIVDGSIGKVLFAQASVLSGGHESWHPDPEFFYCPGAGPMFDMGPYYLTALLHLIGPIRNVQGMSATLIPQRTIATGPKRGRRIDVTTPDHVAGLIEFQCGAVATIVTSFCGLHSPLPPLTVFGTEGTLAVPDPNRFDGPVCVRRSSDSDWREVDQVHHKGYRRGVGVAEMADALRSHRPHRASAEQALAVLDVMAGFLDSAQQRRSHDVLTTCTTPAPLAPGLAFQQFEKELEGHVPSEAGEADP